MEKMKMHFPMVLEWRIYNWTKKSLAMLDSFNNRKDFYFEIYPDNDRLSHPSSINDPYVTLGFSSFYIVAAVGDTKETPKVEQDLYILSNKNISIIIRELIRSQILVNR